MDSRFYTQEQFLQRAHEVHGDRYDYSKSVYKRHDQKLTITCREHGDFQQRPVYHLLGKGCRSCAHTGWHDENRVAAKERGDKLFEGKPCKDGHTTRYVCNSSCAICAIEQRKASNARNHPIRANRVKEAAICKGNKRVEEWLKAIYKAARRQGKCVQVDHIIPLKNDTVCGLHVPWNLQLASATYNYSKNNRLTSEPEALRGTDTVLVHSSALPWNLKEQNNARV